MEEDKGGEGEWGAGEIGCVAGKGENVGGGGGVGGPEEEGEDIDEEGEPIEEEEEAV